MPQETGHRTVGSSKGHLSASKPQSKEGLLARLGQPKQSSKR